MAPRPKEAESLYSQELSMFSDSELDRAPTPLSPKEMAEFVRERVKQVNEIVQADPNYRFRVAKEAVYSFWKMRMLTYGLLAQISREQRLSRKQYQRLRQYLFRLREVRSPCRIEATTYGQKERTPFGIQAELIFEYPSTEHFYSITPEEWKNKRGKAKLWKSERGTLWVYPKKMVQHIYSTYGSGKDFWRNSEDPELRRIMKLHILSKSDFPQIPNKKEIKGSRHPIYRGSTKIGVMVFGDSSDPENVEFEVSAEMRAKIVMAKPSERKEAIKALCHDVPYEADRLLAEWYKLSSKTGNAA